MSIKVSLPVCFPSCELLLHFICKKDAHLKICFCYVCSLTESHFQCAHHTYSNLLLNITFCFVSSYETEAKFTFLEQVNKKKLISFMSVSS